MSPRRIFQFASFAAGTALLIWGLLNPAFYNSEGFPATSFCLILSAFVSLCLFGWMIGKKWERFGFWMMLALIGQAAALQTIDAGTRLHYQHYRLFHSTPALLILTLQGLLVLFTTIKNLGIVRAWFSRIGMLRFTGLAFVIFFSGAALSESPAGYVQELLFACLLQLISLGNVIIAISQIPEDFIKFRSKWTKPEDKTGSHRFVLIAACWVLFISIFLSVFVYERHPHVTDEVVYFFHARFLASGALTLPPPPVPEAFEVNLMEVENGRWYPTTPFGWPAVLAIGVKAGLGWMVNPLLTALNVILIYSLLKRMYDQATAQMCVLLLCISPWFIYLGMSFMTHALTLTCALGGALGILKARETGKARWALLAGAFVAYVSLIRPLEGVIIGFILGLWVIGFGGARLKVTSILAFILATAIIGATVFPYNKHMSGSASVFPINAYSEKHFGKNTNAYGFGRDRGMGWAIDPFPGHGPLDAMVNSALNAFSLNVELLGWSIGSLIPAALFFFGAAFRPAFWKKSDTAMVFVIAAVYVAYFFYYFSGGPDFGARYWFLMVVPLIALSARGIQFLIAGSSGDRAMLAAGLLGLMAIVNYFPWRAIDKYHHYLGMRPDIRSIAREDNFQNSLILIRGESYPDYASAAIYNPLRFDGSAPILVWDRDPAIAQKVISAFPSKRIWIIDGPSKTHSGYQIVAGPLTSQDIAKQ